MALTTLSKRNAVSGSVIQTVSSVSTYAFQTTSTNFVDIDSSSGVTWETAITPSSSTSKILILPAIMLTNSKSGSGDSRYALTLRGKIGSGSYSQLGDTATDVRFGAYDHGQSGALDGNYHCNQYLWSPSTTDECKVAFKLKGNGGIITVSSANWFSTVTLQEIAG